MMTTFFACDISFSVRLPRSALRSAHFFWRDTFGVVTREDAAQRSLIQGFLFELARTYGTPTYVYDLDKVSQQVSALRGAFPQTDLHPDIHYAVKANPCGAVLRHLAGHGLGAEVITLGELERALRAGFPPAHILLGGPKQDSALRRRAVQAGVKLVSLDSVSQWERWQKDLRKEVGVRFLVRLNPALDPRTHEHLATGAAESKFGMTLLEAQEVGEVLGDKLAGFHVHAGSQIADMNIYDEIFAALRPLYERFPGATTLDLGGGFAVPDFPLERFAQKVAEFLKGLNVRLMLEPGRYLVAESGVLLTRVLHVKKGALRHVIADAGMADLLRPALYSAAHPIRVLGHSDEEVELVEVDVDGPLCENADRLGRGIQLPEVAKGDLLVVEEAGAYGLTMASNYASSLRPAEVVVQEGEARLARRREEVADLWRLECE